MASIRLSNGGIALIDDDDAAVVAHFKWRLKQCNGCAYVVRSVGRNGHAYLHRELCGDRPGLVVDHINGDTLDNRRSNLRHVTRQGNVWNRRATSVCGLKGVTLHKRTGRWQAAISRTYIGLFATAEAAARAYDAAARERFGEVARLNFPDFPKVSP
jgi:hypothetical protein